jgi:hypothetical protein
MLHRRIKKKSFLLIFFCKTISAVCRNIIINEQSHSSKDESPGRHGAGTVSGLCGGCSMIEIKSFWKQSTRALFTMVKKMFDEFMRNWCRRINLDELR